VGGGRARGTAAAEKANMAAELQAMEDQQNAAASVEQHRGEGE
jgi:DNA-directed RNA polymerase subunit beta'